MHQDHHLKSCVNQEHENDISVAFWHALLPEDEPIATYPPRGERRSRIHVANETCDVQNETSIASLPGTHEGSCQGRNTQHSRYVTKSITALRRTRRLQSTASTSSRKEEPEKLDRLDEVLKQLVVVKVFDRVGPRAAEHAQYLKRHRVHQRSGIQVAGRSEASCCDHQKPFQGGCGATEFPR